MQRRVSLSDSCTPDDCIFSAQARTHWKLVGKLFPDIEINSKTGIGEDKKSLGEISSH